jgi:hypothetical protein
LKSGLVPPNALGSSMKSSGVTSETHIKLILKISMQ